MGWDFLSKRGPLGVENKRSGTGFSAILQNNLAPAAAKVPLQQGMKASLFRVSADSLEGEALGQTTTISCSIVKDNLVRTYEFPSAGYRVQGRIKWGNGGHQHEAVFDWLNGTCVRVNGAAFEVSAELLRTDGRGVAIAEDLFVEVGASIGYGTVGHHTAPVLTVLDTDNPRSDPATRIFDIPPFARKVVIYFDNNAAPVIDFGFFGTLQVPDVIASQCGNVAFYIPNGAYAVFVEPATAEPGDTIVVFELAL